MRDTTVPIIYIDVTDPILCDNDNTYKQFYLVSEASLIYLRRARIVIYYHVALLPLHWEI